MPSPQEPIAIIGAGCRFPGSSNRPSKLWELLKQPIEVAREIPQDRFNSAAFYHPNGARGGSTYVKEGYFITDRNIRHFDAQFFSLPPAEADSMDPQHRHLLEVVYEALEDAGLTIERLQGSNTAVFVGLMSNDYSIVTNRDLDHIPKYSAPGIAPSNASSRVSYFFDWHGPALTIDTACSSSLIALNQAVQVLREGTSDIAVVAGTNLILDPLPFVSESKIGMLSPTGRSRMWDVDADGYARGDGVAAVIVKRLSSAIRDGDLIDCIVREVGCNHDGRTQGITMPSGAAQALMIRDTYAKAGLDLNLPSDRCQYFEAHGTGTPAGDPQEASALHNAFFGSGSHDTNDIIYVGSIKTIVGHTEGTAGLAGVLKACLALKHGVIPPNLHLNHLSPSVEPFYKQLRILKDPIPWPALPAGVPRRASVNSFGFGGSNAHAILDAYETENLSPGKLNTADQLSLIPFVFSANTESSLVDMASSYLSYLGNSESISLDNLRHTLSCRRTAFPCKITFAASTMDELLSKIEQRLGEHSTAEDSSFGSRSLSQPSVLGVFTGQGAQWPTMGSKLIASHSPARQLVDTLDESLQTLPKSDRPQWKILDELKKDKDSSRIDKAPLSQPLCTAVQLVLMELLRTAGIKFAAVVGHSSGEIAAAYAAGFIRATDAIRIAYYRGLHAEAASGPNKCKGAMMAVGTSFADAQELCELEDFDGRLCIAASNSPTNVTISGDIDAIKEAKDVLDQENKFTRLLQVDTAYHSHHIRACAEAFEQSLSSCDIPLLQPDDNAPAWLSSVQEKTRMVASEDLKGSYWAKNMTKTVLFSQALEYAVESCGIFNMALEIGPHPALKRPAMETLEGAGIKSVEYIGTFARGKDDVQAVSDCLGSAWARLGTSAVEWDNMVKSYCGLQGPMPVLRNLPLYPWDHQRNFWSESRAGKLFRTQQDTIHELLGKRLTNGISDEMRWKNVLSLKISSWLSGHALKGQVVFPGTGYIAFAMEAAMEAAAGRPVQLIELSDFVIQKAIVIDEVIGNEIVVSLSGINGLEPGYSTILAHFTCCSPVSKESERVGVNAHGSLVITIGEATNDTLLQRERPAAQLTNEDIGKYYDALASLGYGYSGPFRGLSSIRRRLGFASGSINRPSLEERPLLFHPAMLDTSVQSLFASLGVPGDGQWSFYVPSKIRRVTLLPNLCGANLPEQVEFDCAITGVPPDQIRGDIDIISADGVHKCIEIDGLEFVPFSPATEANDRCLFSKVTWTLDRPDGDVAAEHRTTPEMLRKGADQERVAFYYLRKLNETIDQKERNLLQIPIHHEALFNFASFVVRQVSEESLTYTSLDWLHDTHDDILNIMEPYGSDADFNIIRAVGENLPAVIRGEITILEVMTKDNMLEEYYRQGVGCAIANKMVTNLLTQITNRFPCTNILEVGAGTGATTNEILARETPFTTYTYTDVSASFFEKANTMFRRYSDKMIFKTLDIEKRPGDQGFVEHSYDIIVASLVLHVTSSLERTLKNVRSLLKPGGFLVILDVVEINTIPIGLIMGGLPGWWVGQDDGRLYSPNITLPQWNKLLKKTGFAGIDTFTPVMEHDQFNASAFVAQAVDDRVNLLRRPLATRPEEIHLGHLILLGGESMITSSLVDELDDILRPRCHRLVIASSLEELETLELPPLTAVLSLSDIDGPVFKNITERRWENLKRLLGSPSCLLWVTHGSRCEEPDSGTMVGLLRSIMYEHQHQQSQLLEVSDPKDLNARLLAELILRIQLGQQWKAFSGANILWTIEPELLLENGVLKILRQQPDKEANNRHNSSRRIISRDIDLSSGDVNLRWHGSGYSLRESKPHRNPASGLSVVRVEHSTLSSIRTAAGLLFLCLGTDTQSGTRVLALSDQNTSTILTPTPLAANLGTLTNREYLTLVASYLLSQQILARTSTGSVILIHEPHPVLATVLSSRLVGEKRAQIYFSTSRSHICGPGWIWLHPRMPRRAIRRSLPLCVDAFFDFSKSPEERSLGMRIAELLPETCLQERVSSLISRGSTAYTNTEANGTADLLREASAFVAANPEVVDTVQLTPVVSFPLIDISKVEFEASPLVLVDWRRDTIVPVIFEPIDSQKGLFQDDKTYWMIGLAGDLGQSLCDWMADHGAKNIVLTSRSANSRVPEKWVEAHAARGVTIKLIASDVTDINSLKRVRDEIEECLPKIRGVANGALVLRDKFFLNMDLDAFQTVMRPKALGTTNMDNIFNEDTLDWFIAFSSLVATLGNRGQSAYSAANCYVKALINKRRQRGLPGTTIDIGPVLGVGYVEELKATGSATVKMIDLFESSVMTMSESDLHQLFAEAVVASRPDSGRHSDLVTGLRTLSSEDMDKAFWATNIKFSHFIRERVVSRQASDDNVDRIPVRTQLLEANSADDVAKIISVAFITKLKTTLGNSMDQKTLESMALIDLGVDSLVAVEVRTWFLRELGVDMPMLKILNNSTVADLVEDAIAKLPALQKSVSHTKNQDETTSLAVKTDKGTESSSDTLASPSTSTPPPALTSDTPQTSKPNSEYPFINTENIFEPDIIRSEPISFGQARFWFLRQYLDDLTTTNITLCFHFAGNFEPEKLGQALELVCQRHESLRSCFFVKDKAAWQGIMRKSAIRMERRLVSSEADVRKAYESVQNHVYDIESGDTLRLTLCEESSTSFYFILGYDHIAMDGVSWEILFSELQSHYRGSYVPPVGRQYSEWSRRQRNDVMGASLASDRRFWRQEFPTLPPVLPLLPAAKVSSRRRLKTYEVHRASAKIAPDLAILVKDISHANKVSPFHFHLAVFKTLLFRFTGETDICIGMADAGRMDPADSGIIGLLLNLLPLHFECKVNQSFTDTLRDVRTKVYAAMAHSRVPFNVILDDLVVPRSTSHHPLFQAFIEYRQAKTPTFTGLRGDTRPDYKSFARTPYDIELNVLEDHAGDVTISTGLQTGLYSEEVAQLVLRSYLTLLEYFAKYPRLTVQKPRLYAEQDIDAAITLGRGELMESIWPETLSQRIDEMAEAYPHSIAIKDTHGNCLSYKTMIERVKDIQTAMVKTGIREGSNVAVFLQPSTDWICSLLAVMRQGAIYVPLDSSQGLTRLHQIFAISSPTTILVDSSTTQEAAAWARLINVINVNDLQATPDSNPLNAATPNRLAVILFTSGTTGTPKGILFQHSALVNVIEGMIRRYNLGPQTVLQQSAFSFDMSLEQTFLALCNGGTLVVADRSIRGDSRALMKVIATEGITYTKATPPEYLSWFRHGASYVTGNKTWKYIFAGGDRMTKTMKSELRSLGLPHIRLFNSYGPAESTIIATKMEQSYGIDDETDESIPIGFPLPNYSIYIVDDKLNPVPQGVPGEILIGGQGVAIGYLGDTAQTEKKFLDNPWAGPEYVKRGWTKMYRSGDKGHFTKQGALVFHGRIAGDTQVKLQGIRLELEDIENNILKEGKGSLSEAVCTVHGESDSNYLVAHVVFSPGFPSSVDVGREFLSRLLQQLPLPQYMKPAALFPLESLPLTMHGKIDRAAIAAIPVAQNVGGGEKDCKLSELESRLGSIWRQLLPKEALPASLNRSSDFFTLGGSSMLLLEVQFLIRTNFNIDISLQELFEVTTLVKMAAKIQVLVNAKAVNWDLETTPPRTDEFVDAEPQPIRLTGLEVVMTGTTGHLGCFILDGLVADPAIAKIHCVAVRDPSKLRSTSDKVIVHQGDLAKAQLGLPTSDLTHLASTADAIIHCGATRLSWETFESMVAVNVTSTRELIRLAAPRRVPIHFVSSGGVFPADVAPSEMSAASHMPPSVGVDGYVASKWASEQMLERSARDIGLPVHIYRTVRADEGTFPEELPEEILAGMAEATIESMVMMEHGGDAWVGWFDLVSAIDVAGSICTAVSTRMALSGELGVRFVNHKGTYRVWKDEHLNKLVARPEIQERMGRLKMVPPPIWLGELKRSGFPWMIGASDAFYKDLVRNRR